MWHRSGKTPWRVCAAVAGLAFEIQTPNLHFFPLYSRTPHLLGHDVFYTRFFIIILVANFLDFSIKKSDTSFHS